MRPLVYLAFVLFTLHCATAKVDVDRIFATFKVCKEQTHATEDITTGLKNYKFPTTQNGKCMMHCVLEKYNMMKGDQFITQEFMDWFEMSYSDNKDRLEVAAKAVGICSTKLPEMKNFDKCEKATRMVKCVYDLGVRVLDNNY